LSKSLEQVGAEITFEVGQIDQLLNTYADLLSRVLVRDPDTVEIAAVATVLHSFYNGLENVFLTVVKDIDDSVPSGGQSHRELLFQVTKKTDKRDALVSKSTAKLLGDYLGFRHFYRHSYSFLIDWGELRKLVTPLDQNWATTKREFEQFIAGLKS